MVRLFRFDGWKRSVLADESNGQGNPIDEEGRRVSFSWPILLQNTSGWLSSSFPDNASRGSFGSRTGKRAFPKISPSGCSESFRGS